MKTDALVSPVVLSRSEDSPPFGKRPGPNPCTTPRMLEQSSEGSQGVQGATE